MEYQQKKEQILSGVQYTNLLSFSLVENKLERNFKAIVEALLLSQGKTDEVLAKTDHLEDRLTIDRQKNAQEQEGLKQALKQLGERVAKIESQANSNRIAKSESSKNIKEAKEADRSEVARKENYPSEPSGSTEKNSFLDKKIEDAFHQIAALKDKMPALKLMETELEGMKRDLTMIRGELMTVGKSSKSIKRDSIAPVLSPSPSPTLNPSSSNKVLMRRESSSKIGKGAVLSHSNSSVHLLEGENKENKNQQIEANKIQTNASNVVSGDDSSLERELQGLHIEVNTLNLCFQELKGQVQDLRKKDIRYHSTLAELEDKQRKIQDEMRKDSEAFEKNLKSIQLTIMNMPSSSSSSSSSEPVPKTPSKESDSPSQSKRGGSPSSASFDENTMNFKNQINDKLNKLQNSLLGFVSQSEFNRFKGEARAKLEQSERKHDKLVNEFQQEIKKIYDLFINKDLDINRLGELIAATAQTIKQNHSQAERKHNIAIARADELKKNLQNLREDVQFYQAMNADNKEVKEKLAEEAKKQEETGAIMREGGVDPKALEDLKKYFNNKLHDQRAYLVGLIRDLEKKQNSASGVNQEIANLWDKINEVNVFLGKKGDAEDIKKNLIYLEKKINKIGSQLIKAEDNTEDARIARTNWFCLSCDKNLLGYQGKLGKHIVWDSMPLKGTVKNVDKKGLPSLKK